MSDKPEFRISELRSKRSQSGAQADPLNSTVPGSSPGSLLPVPVDAPPGAGGESRTGMSGGGQPRFPFDPRRLLESLRRQWRAIAGAGLLVGVLAALLGYWLTPYRVSVAMIFRDAPSQFQSLIGGETFKPRELSRPMVVSLLDSRTLAERAAGKTTPPMTAAAMLDSVEVVYHRDMPEKISLRFYGKNPQRLVELANLYTSEAVQMTREEQLAEGKWVADFCRKKLEELDAEVQQVNSNLAQFHKETQVVDPEIEARAYVKTHGELNLDYERARIEREMLDERLSLARRTESNDRLRAARERLQDLLTRFTEVHHEVVSQQRAIAALEQQLAVAGNAQIAELENQKKLVERKLEVLDQARQRLQGILSSLSENGRRYAELKSRLESLQTGRALLEDRRRETAFYDGSVQGYFRVPAPARLEDINLFARGSKAAWFGVSGVLAGVLLAAFLALGAEVLDDRVKSSDDIKRITGLPVLATLGDLEKMSEVERENWAFRAWTLIAGRLSKSANHGLVCGFISANAGEGRSTWVSLLAEAASQRGLRVLTVTADGANDGASMSEESPVTVPDQSAGASSEESAGPFVSVPPKSSNALAPGVLPSPAELTRRLTESQMLPVVSVPLPDRVWDLDRRRQWHSALAHWRAIEGLVILVELPPASKPESVLLAESVPQLIWVAGSGQSRARETRMHLETLRHARCRVAGAVLNREPDLLFKS